MKNKTFAVSIIMATMLFVACGNRTKTEEKQTVLDASDTLVERIDEGLEKLCVREDTVIWIFVEDDEYTLDFVKERTVGDFSAVLQKRSAEYVKSRPHLDSLYESSARERARLDLSLICNAPDIWWWRLNQYYPIEKKAKDKKTEVQLTKAILDSLFLPTYDGSQLFMNMESWTYTAIQKKLMEYYWQKIVSQSSIPSVLMQEHNAWESYAQASILSADSVFLGREHYSMRSMEEGIWRLELYQERFQSFISLYDLQEYETLPSVTIETIDSLSEAKFGNMTFPEDVSPADVETFHEIWRQEQKAWSNWIRARKEVSKHLSGTKKKCYDVATNNCICQRKKLLVRNEGDL